MRMDRIIAIALVLGAALAAAPEAVAQKLSDRLITIIVPYSPGTGPDLLARLIAEEIQQPRRQPAAVDTKPGAPGRARSISGRPASAGRIISRWSCSS